MPPIFRKELRQQRILAIAFALVFTGLAGLMLWDGMCLPISVVNAHSAFNMDSVIPLLANGYITFYLWLCATFSGVLGWKQMRTAQQLGKLPTLGRNRILTDKLAAGLLLYALAAGLPLLLLVGACTAPGVLAAPFSWRLGLPLLVAWSCGLPFYAAGMLTALRQARWLGSRTVGLWVALIVAAWYEFLSIYTLSGFLFSIIAVGTSLLLVAVWGSFQNDGSNRNLPGLAQAAVAIGVTTTVFLCSVVLVSGVLTLLFEQRTTRDYVTVLPDGTVCHPGTSNSGSYVTLDNKPVPGTAPVPYWDPATKRQLPLCVQMLVDGNNSREYGPKKICPFMLWRISGQTIWYLTQTGELRGYDANTRRLVTNLRPPPDDKSHSKHFLYLPSTSGDRQDYQPKAQEYLASATTLYEVNCTNHTLRPVFTTTPDDEILNFAHEYDNYSAEHPDFARPAPNADSRAPMLIVTRKRVVILPTPESAPIAVSFKSRTFALNYRLFCLQPSGYLLEILVDRSFFSEVDPLLPDTYMWLSAEGAVQRSVPFYSSIPVTPQPPHWSVMLFVPPIIIGTTLCDTHARTLHKPLYAIPALAIAILFALIVWKLGRAYCFAAWRQWLWGAWVLLFGLAGLLAFFAVQHWPVRIPCPACGRRCTIAQDACEHCTAPLPQPPKDGTEILPQTAEHGADKPCQQP